MLSSDLVKIREALDHVPYVAHINNPCDYERALKQMDELFDDYDTNKQLIELLANSIERWEDESEEFAGFNRVLACVEPGISVLKTLMGHHRLGMADLPDLPDLPEL